MSIEAGIEKPLSGLWLVPSSPVETPLVDTDPIDPELLVGSITTVSAAQLILNALPEACRTCPRAMQATERMAWAAELGDRGPVQKLASVVLEQTGCTKVS